MLLYMYQVLALYKVIFIFLNISSSLLWYNFLIHESSMELWAETLNIITDILNILLLIIVSSSILFPFITQLGCVTISNFEYFNLK